MTWLQPSRCLAARLVGQRRLVCGLPLRQSLAHYVVAGSAARAARVVATCSVCVMCGRCIAGCSTSAVLRRIASAPGAFSGVLLGLFMLGFVHMVAVLSFVFTKALAVGLSAGAVVATSDRSISGIVCPLTVDLSVLGFASAPCQNRSIVTILFV